MTKPCCNASIRACWRSSKAGSSHEYLVAPALANPGSDVQAAGAQSACHTVQRNCDRRRPGTSAGRLHAAAEPEQCLASDSVSYTHLRAHETGRNLVCRL